MADNRLLSLNLGTKKAKAFARETCSLRGFEVAVTGAVEVHRDRTVIAADGT